ncbi:unnamed protein product [Rangifer tarandus platyrhynchus]|uniref:Uncharacterized protein n=1 Tax=Rangifer tarandus platyrhynchus TaxID=3082113 RepID=A0ABN8ZRQ3_RANTA|nr:unnamed protein product [Rangifer tarandus platyrhynchus]
MRGAPGSPNKDSLLLPHCLLVRLEEHSPVGQSVCLGVPSAREAGGAAGAAVSGTRAPRRPSHRRRCHRRRPGRDSDTGRESARAGACAGLGGGGRPTGAAAPTPGSETRPRLGPVFRIPSEPRELRLGAGRGESGFPGPDTGGSPDLGRRRDPARATLGTPGRDRRRRTPGETGIPTQGRDPHACSSTLPRDGPRPPSVCEVRAAPEIWSGALQERSGTPQETGALNSGASPLIVQTQFLYESAANRELWLDICG